MSAKSLIEPAGIPSANFYAFARNTYAGIQEHLLNYNTASM